MSLAFERSIHSSDRRTGLLPEMPCFSGCGSSTGMTGLTASGGRLRVEREEDSGSCSSSSIGKNSDVSGESSDGEDSAEAEVQSSLKGPLENLNSLEEVLPMRRGISKFYNGKSKSFTSLADAAAVSSIKEFAKPENPCTRKRKNLLAHNALMEKDQNCYLRSKGSEILKRAANSSRSAVSLGGPTNSFKSNDPEDSATISSSPSNCLPPLYPHSKQSPNFESSILPTRRIPPFRSFSLSDLQCVVAETPNIDTHCKLHPT